MKERDPSSPSLRELSKKYAPKERSETAAKIWEIRRRDQERRNAIVREIESVSREQELQTVKIRSLQKELDDVDAVLAQKSRNFVAKIGNFFTIRNIKQVRDQRENRLFDVKAQYAKTLELLGEYQEQKQDTRLVQEAQATLDTFYERQREKLPQYQTAEEEAARQELERREADRKARSVSETMKRHDVYIVHGIRPDFIPEGNSLLREHTDWKTKLKIALAFSPEISTSTYGRTDGVKNLWGPFGIMVRGGEITSAHQVDQGTKVRADMVRRVFSTYSTRNAEQQIRDAILGRGIGHSAHNELTVRQPDIAGLFVCEPLQDDHAQRGMPQHSEIQLMAQETGLPVYVLEHGRCYTAEYDEATKRFVKKDELSPEVVTRNKPMVDEATLDKYREELFTDSPFRFEHLPEFANIDSIATGRELYLALSVGKNPSQFAGPKELDEKGKERQIVAEIPQSGKMLKYYIRNGRLICDRVPSVSKKVEWSIEMRYEDLTSSTYIRLGYNTWDMGNPVRGIREYVRLMGEQISQEKEKLTAATTRGNAEDISYESRIVARLTAHAYGFAKQAQEMGDTQASDAAMQIVLRAGFDGTSFEELLSKRIGPHGAMKITEEDLPKNG